jgi:hypothetical protein
MFPANVNINVADLVRSPSDNKVEMTISGFTIENHRLRLDYFRENGVFHQVNLDIITSLVVKIEGYLKLEQDRVSEIQAQRIYALTDDPKIGEAYLIAETALEKDPEPTLEDFCGCQEQYEFIKKLMDHCEYRKDTFVEPKQEWFVYANQVLGNSLEKLDFIRVYLKWESEFKKKKETKSVWDYLGLKSLTDYLLMQTKKAKESIE